MRVNFWTIRGQINAKPRTESSRSIGSRRAASTSSRSSNIRKTLAASSANRAAATKVPYVRAPVSPVTTCHYMFPMLSIAGARVVFSAQGARLVPYPIGPPGEIKRWYAGLDVAVQIPLPTTGTSKR